MDLALYPFALEAVIFGVELVLKAGYPQDNDIGLVFQVLHLLAGSAHGFSPVAFRPALKVHGFVGIGFVDLGRALFLRIISGGGLLICLVPMMTLLRLAIGFGLAVALALRDLVETLNLDALMIDTHPGLNEETLLSIAISDVLLIILRPDQQDYQGTGVTVEVARKLNVPHMLLVVNKVPSVFNPADVKAQIEKTYNVEVAAVLPHSDEMMALASSGIFVLRYPNHPVTQQYAPDFSTKPAVAPTNLAVNNLAGRNSLKWDDFSNPSNAKGVNTFQPKCIN